MICHRIGDCTLRLHCHLEGGGGVAMVQLVTRPHSLREELNWLVQPSLGLHLSTLKSLFAAAIDGNEIGIEIYRELSPIIDFIIETESPAKDYKYALLRERLTEIVSQHHTGVTT